MSFVRTGYTHVTSVTVPGRKTTAVSAEDVVVPVKVQGRRVTVQPLVVPVSNPGTPETIEQPMTTTYYSYTPQAVWSFKHPLGRIPKVAVYSMSGELIEGEVQTTETTVTVSFNVPVSGYVVLS